MKQNQNGLRLLLGFGGVVCLAVGLTGLLWAGALRIPLGAEEPGGVHARLLGAFAMAVAIGFGVVAADPARHRPAIAVLFGVPAFVLVALAIAVAADEMSMSQGVPLIVADVAYLLLFFRLYPRPAAVAAGSPDDKSPAAEQSAPRASEPPAEASAGEGQISSASRGSEGDTPDRAEGTT